MSLGEKLIKSQQNLIEAKLPAGNTYEFDDFLLDAGRLMLYRGGQTISLKPKVVETLVALVEQGSQVVSKQELMDRLWADSFVEESNLTQNIYLLRKTLGKSSDGRPFIETFSRRGYRFNGLLNAAHAADLVIAQHTRTHTVVEETTEPRAGRVWLIAGLVILAASVAMVFAVREVIQYAPETKAAAASSFRSFKLKRHTEKGDVTSAKVSPDGRYIAYTDKEGSLWVKNTVTDSSIKVVHGSIGTVSAISPDNNYVYFARGFTDKPIEVLKMPLLGGGVQQKITAGVGSDVALSPDGTQLAFVRDEKKAGHALVIANTDGTGERTVAVSKPGEWFGMWSQSTAWSPDSSKIAYTGGVTSDGKATWNIKILRVVDGQEFATVPAQANTGWFDAVVWMPDGDDLLVIRGDRAMQGQIYKYTLSNGAWQRITNDLTDYSHLSATLDGTTIITTQQANPGNLWVLPANGDTSQAKQITFGRNLMTDATGVSWTADGKIVYATNAGGKWEIWKIDADGANQTQLTQDCSGNDSCGRPAVSPDGKYIVFQAGLDGISNLWRMDIDGANVRRLTSSGGFAPTFTPDGHQVVYTRFVGGDMTLAQVPVEGGEEVRFGNLPTGAHAEISPDGKQMAFSYYDRDKPSQHTCIAPVDAAAPEKCFELSRSFPRWVADGTAFYYLDHGYSGVWRQPVSGTRTEFVKFAGERTNNFAFSRDGKAMVVARSTATQDIVAITDEQ